MTKYLKEDALNVSLKNKEGVRKRRIRNNPRRIKIRNCFRTIRKRLKKT